MIRNPRKIENKKQAETLFETGYQKAMTKALKCPELKPKAIEDCLVELRERDATQRKTIEQHLKEIERNLDLAKQKPEPAPEADRKIKHGPTLVATPAIPIRR